jgi:ATP-dependent helicase YprA (DUF1998 family)
MFHSLRVAECISHLESRSRPLRLVLYDKRPSTCGTAGAGGEGGSGIAREVFPHMLKLLEAALHLIATCSCGEASITGCPSCIQDPHCSEKNMVLDKRAAACILGLVVASAHSRA